jgi:hypothetical protein
MLERSRELIYALVAVALIALVYGVARLVLRENPAAGSLFGHSLGILGFVLMLMTETLSSIRKRSRRATWGKMSNWLEFHIFTGLVGPFMVLIHTAWDWRGLAGLVTWMTLAIVISGFIGRYIFTAIPRTASGVEVSLDELERQVAELELALAVGQPLATAQGAAAYAAAPTRPLGADKTLQATRRKRDRLKRQIGSLAASRRFLAIWHAVHVPLGLALFAMAFVHIGAAIYYATLLR